MYRTLDHFKLPGVSIEYSDDHVILTSESPMNILSSAVLNGGMNATRSIINMRVTENYKGEQTDFISPEHSLARYANDRDLPFPVTGMMTSALLSCFRGVTTVHETTGHHIAVAVTAGLSNARAAGDYAEYREIPESPMKTGTINIIVGTTMNLSPAAQTEAIMIMTEAKTALLHELGEMSRISSLPATGTGTDSSAIFSVQEGESVSFCGKHTIVGEMLARSVKLALRRSLSES